MPRRMMEKQCNYYVDEAGDPIIFGKKKKLRIGTDGASRFFFVGLLDIGNPAFVTKSLEEFRNSLLADEKLSQLPGMRLEDKLSAEKFHATDDHPIIRRKVYEFLGTIKGLRFNCVLKDKMAVHKYVIQRQSIEPSYSYTQTELYDHCVRRLFRDKLHRYSEYDITFARWNKAERRRELTAALIRAKEKFFEKHGVRVDNRISIQSCLPKDVVGLQIADYFLWAVQRLYEREDDSYFSHIAKKYRLIMDVDDTRKSSYGCYYTTNFLPTPESIRERKQSG
jgi:hypothetical protein